jgi:hypothetical protein
MTKFQSLDELMREEEVANLERARREIAAEAPAVAARLKAEEERRKTIPVWVVYDGEYTGPYTNDDAAIAYMAEQKIPQHEALMVDSEDAAKECVKPDEEDDDEEE